MRACTAFRLNQALRDDRRVSGEVIGPHVDNGSKHDARNESKRNVSYGWKADVPQSGKIGTTFRAFGSKRQAYAAIFLTPEAGPEPLIPPEPFIRLIIGECRPAAVVTLDTEQPGTWDKAEKSYGGGP